RWSSRRSSPPGSTRTPPARAGGRAPGGGWASPTAPALFCPTAHKRGARASAGEGTTRPSELFSTRRTHWRQWASSRSRCPGAGRLRSLDRALALDDVAVLIVGDIGATEDIADGLAELVLALDVGQSLTDPGLLDPVDHGHHHHAVDLGHVKGAD